MALVRGRKGQSGGAVKGNEKLSKFNDYSRKDET